MSRYPVTCTLAFLLALLLLIPAVSQAQRTYGVLWDVPDSSEEALHQLDRFRELKIQYLELDEVVSDELWSAIRARGFRVFVQVPVRFPVVQTFAEADSSLVDSYESFIKAYTGREVEAVGAFAYGQTHNSFFATSVAPFADQLRSSLSMPVYFKDWSLAPHPADSVLDFAIEKIDVPQNFQSRTNLNVRTHRGFIYSPASSIEDNVAPLKWFFERTSASPGAILFFHSDWLLNFVDHHHSAGRVLVEQATLRDAVFPLPEEQLPTGNSHSLIVLILVLLWGTVALNYNFIPMYRRALFRFFLSHRFFIEDVLNRHIRDLLPSLIILVQHAILGGILSYSMAHTFISAAGIEVLLAYFPVFSVMGTGYLSFLYWGAALVFIFELLSLGWLYAANRKIGYLSQVSILYSWPFHLNLVITTIIVTLMTSDGSAYLLSICFILFLLILLIDFPLTALDSGKNIKKFKWTYALGTVGLYCLLLAVGILSVLMNDYLLNILDLAISIT